MHFRKSHGHGQEDLAFEVDTGGGNVESLLENERIICPNLDGLQRWATHLCGLLWCLEGWMARDEAPLEAVVMCTKDTPYPFAIACDAKMEPEVVVQGSGSVNEA